jgi:hypothetical protein
MLTGRFSSGREKKSCFTWVLEVISLVTLGLTDKWKYMGLDAFFATFMMDSNGSLHISSGSDRFRWDNIINTVTADLDGSRGILQFSCYRLRWVQIGYYRTLATDSDGFKLCRYYGTFAIDLTGFTWDTTVFLREIQMSSNGTTIFSNHGKNAPPTLVARISIHRWQTVLPFQQCVDAIDSGKFSQDTIVVSPAA